MKTPIGSLRDLNGSRGEELQVVGGGRLVEEVLGPFTYREFWLLPGRWGRGTTLERCTLRGWRATRATLQRTRLDGCDLVEAHLPWVDGSIDLVDCRVSGTFAATLSGTRAVHGNDFSQAVGTGFADGVPLHSNVFATDGSQLVVHREALSYGALLERAASGDPVAMDLSLKMSGPQAWQVLYRSQTAPEDWTFYWDAFGPPEGRRGDPSVELEQDDGPAPSFGRGVVRFLRAASDAQADEVGRRLTAPTLDVQLSTEGLRALGAVLGVSAGVLVVREDENHMLVRLSEGLTHALTEAERDGLLIAWQEAALDPMGNHWADEPADALDELLRVAAACRPPEHVYALILG